MPAFRNLKGQTIGRLTVLKHRKIDKINYWVCRCNCDNKVLNIKSAYLTRSKPVQSCGCLRKENAVKVGHKNTILLGKGKHGLYKHPLYRCHQAMLYRCYWEGSQSYEYYGGRGITVCDRWLGSNGLHNFIEDMYPTFLKGLQIDRINNEQGYIKSNCQWVTSKEQLNNTRFNRCVKINKEVLTIAQASEKYNVHPATILRRLKKGWSEEKSVLTPPTQKFLQWRKTKCQSSHTKALKKDVKRGFFFTLGKKKQSVMV